MSSGQVKKWPDEAGIDGVSVHTLEHPSLLGRLLEDQALGQIRKPQGTGT
jgi:hypothetical protein